MTIKGDQMSRMLNASVVLVSIMGALAVALAIPVTASAAPIPLEYEAEDAFLFGGAGVNNNHLGYSGTGFVDGFVIDHQGTAGITFTVDVPEDGEYGLNLRYANGLGADMTLSRVIGADHQQLVLPSAAGASWSQWFIFQETVVLEAGEQQITYRFDDDDTGNVNIDAIALTVVGDLDTPGGGATDPDDIPGVGPDTRWDAVSTPLATTAGFASGTAYAAAESFYANGAQAVPHDGHEAVDLAASRARVVVPVFATTDQTQRVAVRYLNEGDDAEVVVGIDGTPLGVLSLPSVGTWTTTTFEVPLRLGLSTIELRRGVDEADAQLLIDTVTVEHAQEPQAVGATTGTTQYEAEHGLTTGEILEASRTFRELASEASGRQAVVLHGEGDYVEWTLTAPADALALRASIPDSLDGTGLEGSLGLYVAETKIADIQVSSAYSWVYGDYPYGNDPTQGGAQRFFDESRVTFPALPAGTVLRLQKDGDSADLPYTVDLIETEVRPAPLTPPSGALDIRDYGATADDGTDDTAAIQAAVDAANADGGVVWIPEGRFVLTDLIRLANVSVRGAGPWYSVLEGRDNHGGLYGMGSGVTIADLMIDGDVRYRNDALFDSGIEGNLGQGSLIQNVWITHTKTGVWITASTDGLYVVGVRVRDTFADGIHLRGGATDVRIEHSTVRNTGDDAMAMWSIGGAVIRGVFAHNTVQSPLLGNGAAIYGGDSNSLIGLSIADTLTAPAGIAVSTRFNPIPFSGTTTVAHNDIYRSGGWEPNWSTSFGGIWVFADTSHITTPILISDTRIIDSSYEGILVSGSHWVNDLRVKDVTIEGTGAYAVAARVGGDHRFQNVRASAVVEPDDARNHFWGTFIDEGSNDGLLYPVDAMCLVRQVSQEPQDGHFTSQVTLTNTGPGPLDTQRLSWHVGSGEVVLDGTGVTVSQNGTRVEVALPQAQLDSGEDVTFTVSGTTNTSTVAQAGVFTLDGLPCETKPNLAVSIALQAAADAGEEIAVTVTVVNDGQFATPGTEVSVTLPADAEGVVVEDGGIYDAPTYTATWAPQTVAAGASVSHALTFTIEAGDRDPGDHLFLVDAAVTYDGSAGAEQTTEDNSASATTTVTVPGGPSEDLPQVSVAPVAPTEAGDTFTYEITVSPQDPSTGSVMVLQELPARIDVESVTLPAGWTNLNAPLPVGPHPDGSTPGTWLALSAPDLPVQVVIEVTASLLPLTQAPVVNDEGSLTADVPPVVTAPADQLISDVCVAADVGQGTESTCHALVLPVKDIVAAVTVRLVDGITYLIVSVATTQSLDGEPVTLTWTSQEGASSQVVLTDLEPGVNHIVPWPGAQFDEDGRVTAWPGWRPMTAADRNGAGQVLDPTTGLPMTAEQLNESVHGNLILDPAAPGAAWRGTSTLTLSVNPSIEFALAYREVLSASGGAGGGALPGTGATVGFLFWLAILTTAAGGSALVLGWLTRTAPLATRRNH